MRSQAHRPALEELWRRAAMHSVATGDLRDPPASEAMRLTGRGLAWADVPEWPSAVLDDRIGRLIDSHRLAIALADAGWLRQLERVWELAPDRVDPLRRLRAQGEIGLGLGRAGTRPRGWDAAEIQTLVAEGYMVPGVPAEEAWMALGRGDAPAAQRALLALDSQWLSLRREWESAPDAAIRQLELAPGAALRVEARALEAILLRAPLDGWASGD